MTSPQITLGLGQAVPPANRHSITVLMPTWADVERYGDDSTSLIAGFQNVYPRMRPNDDIARLASATLDYIKAAEDVGCLIFSSRQSAEECVAYAVSDKRVSPDKPPVPVDQISIRSFVAQDRFFTVFFPHRSRLTLSGFWSTPGVGISSRFAAANLLHVSELREVSVAEPDDTTPVHFEGPTHQCLRERIVHLLNRATLDSNPQPSSDDVYFFPTGMAAIYKPHSYMLSLGPGTTVLFGMAFMNTLTLFEELAHEYRFFGLGTDEDLSELESFLQKEHDEGRIVRAIWTEFPANPILTTPNLKKLRALADQYDIILAVDETVGSFSNVDISSVADVISTSLTKSFNGYADVIAGSAILNRSSRRYNDLKSLFDQYYVPELYIDDAETIERNSRDYLSRTLRLNDNAKSIAEFLHSRAEDPRSAVLKVYYPSLNPSGVYYKQFMRRATDDFSPGYGCLLNVEFDDLPSAAAFYDRLNLYKGPNLGAPFTLVFAYTMCAYKKRLDWAAQYGLRPTQIRVSAGLETEQGLIEEFKLAVEAADRVKASVFTTTESAASGMERD
ncbi:PLP-dependent transferase [Xylaria arbuscula]|nr:PLP-dependent transferase [Xylaria arbuscula]